MKHAFPLALLILAVVVSCARAAMAADLSVGPGQRFARLEEALAAAKPGDVMLVHPAKEPAGYAKTALMVRTAGITFRAVKGESQSLVKLSGEGFDYTGDGPVPRAIIQFDPQAKGCVLEGFDLSGAHNGDHNGAGVRINAANQITLRDCDIHDNDMGIMSNGRLDEHTGDAQLIEACRIHNNGNAKEPGQNHNLYLGGTAAMLRGCEVFASSTGHNVKSRAHLTYIEGCYVHDAAAREIDLVDQKGNTDVPESNAVVAGNILLKGDRNDANHTVIHFGQDVKQGRVGTIWVVNNTIVTPFISPMLQLSAPKTSAVLANNIIWDKGSGQKNQVLVGLTNGADLKNVSGAHNWLSPGFSGPDLATLDAATTWLGQRGQTPPFANAAKGDYRLLGTSEPFVRGGVAWKSIPTWLPEAGVWQFVSSNGATQRTDDAAPSLGAMEVAK